MKNLKCDRQEAEDIYEYDVAVNHDEKTPYDLPPDKEKIARKYAHTGTRKAPTTFNFSKRERKPNATKEGIISELASFLTENSAFSVKNFQITNKERQIAFEIGDKKFELTLVQKRKPKE